MNRRSATRSRGYPRAHPHSSPHKSKPLIASGRRLILHPTISTRALFRRSDARQGNRRGRGGGGERIQESLARFGERMEKRLFTDAEIAYRRRHKDPLPHCRRASPPRKPFKAIGTSAVRRCRVETCRGHPARRTGGPCSCTRVWPSSDLTALGCTSSHLSPHPDDGGMAIARVVIEGNMSARSARRGFGSRWSPTGARSRCAWIRGAARSSGSRRSRFSEPDREALHVLLADEAYPIDPALRARVTEPRARDRDRAPRARGCHPPRLRILRGERDFARACAEAGVVSSARRPDHRGALHASPRGPWRGRPGLAGAGRRGAP